MRNVKKVIVGIVLMAMLVAGCGLDVELQLGTMAIKSQLSVDEWARNPLLDNLSSLLQRDKDGEAVKEDEGETNSVE